ncbi:MAG: hypothetical protein HGA61_01085 [Candidatus Moranbacteria bacterium]|nr:hypothetical protein [Candidatus Moranbacteria bacterium]
MPNDRLEKIKSSAIYASNFYKFASFDGLMSDRKLQAIGYGFQSSKSVS